MYLQNKYTRWYYNIIDRARTRTIDGYSERHHIIPKSLGGSNEAHNLIRLTAREHYICHRLLVKMVEGQDRSKMALAATKMWQKGSNQERNYRLNSRTYDFLKREASAFLSEVNRRRWADPKMRNQLIESFKQAKRSDATKKPISEETRNKMRESALKRDNSNRVSWNKGKKGLQVAWNKGITWSKKSTQKKP